MNKFLVGVQADDVVIMMPTGPMSKLDALGLAAWLVALADEGDQFGRILDAVKNT